MVLLIAPSKRTLVTICLITILNGKDLQAEPFIEACYDKRKFMKQKNSILLLLTKYYAH